MNIQNKKNIVRYIKTICLTILFTIGIVFLSILFINYQINRELIKAQEVKTHVKENSIDDRLVERLIAQNLIKEEEVPEDYRVNLRLGTLYEMRKDYEHAKIHYKDAILKAPYGEYTPAYKLALLYLHEDELKEAQKTMDDIGEKPSKNLIKFKGDIYERLGDKYYNLANYEEAISKYEKSKFYYNIIHSKQAESVNGGLASAYIYLAEEKVQKMEINIAINYLKLAREIIDAPIIKYKLAILLAKTEPELAYQYLKEVFREEPIIINYEHYCEFLGFMAENAQLKGEFAKAKLYRFKQKQMKEYYTTNVLSVDDILIDDIKGSIKSDNWKRKYNINVSFRLENSSEYDINSLYMEMIFEDKGIIVDTYHKKIIDSKTLLKVGEQGPIINIHTSLKKVHKEKRLKELNVKIYISKKENSHKLLLKEFKIKEEPKRGLKIKLFSRIFYLPYFGF